MDTARPLEPTRLRIRRLTSMDLPVIQSLYHGGAAGQSITEAFYACQGEDLAELAENSSIAIVAEYENLSIAGLALLDNYPTVLEGRTEVANDDRGLTRQKSSNASENENTRGNLVYHQWGPLSKAQRIYQYNSLWFKYFVAQSGDEPRILGEVCQWVLAAFPEVNHLLLHVGKELAIEAHTFGLRPYLKLFTEIPGPFDQRGFSGSNCSIYHCPRERAFPPLTICAATVEDHDDLVKVFDAQSDVVTDIYGEYFLAELIAAQDESHKSLVARPCGPNDSDGQGKAVGLMCITTEVDINVLVKCFHLEDYDFLLKPKFARMARGSLVAEACRNAQRAKRDSTCGYSSIGDRLQFTLELLDLDSVLATLTEDLDGSVSTGLIEIPQLISAVVSALEHTPIDDGDTCRSLPPADLQKALEDLFQHTTSPRPIGEVTSTLDTFLDIDEDLRRSIGDALLEARSTGYGRLCQQVPTRDGSQGAAALTLTEPKERSGVDGICAMLSESDLPADSAVLKMVLTLWGGLSQDDLSTEALDASIMTLCGLTELPPVVTEHEPEAATAKLSLPPSHDLWLSDVPQSAKDVFCINMFCLDPQYQRHSPDFLLPAFSMFPDKNYCVLTQPHDVPQSNFLSSMFTQIRPKIGTTIHHVLYLAHRDSFFARISGSPLLLTDRNPHWEVAVLPRSSSLASLDWSKLEPVASSITDKHRDSLQRRYENDEVIVIAVLLDAQPVAMIGVEMITSNDKEADPIDILRYCYDVDQYLSPAAYKGSGSCCRLIHWGIIPILIGQTRRILNMANTALGTRLMSIAVSNSLSHDDSRLSLASSSGRSGILDEFVHLRPRRLPGLTTIKRIPPTATTFARMDESDTPTARWQQREWKESIGGRQEKALETHGKRLRFLEGTLRDAYTQCESMKILTKKMILDKKCIVNARIVVVGASDTGLSALSSLMSMPRLHFTSLTLLAPGGISYFLDDDLDPLTHQEASLSRLFKSQASERGHTASLRQVRRLTATTGAFSPRELRRLMMDSRVRILDARMISLNRGAKTISVVPSCEDGSEAEASGRLIEVPYDYLVFTPGLQDRGLHSLNIRSMGVADIPLGFRHVNGCLSSADSSCDKILGDGSILLKSLIWNPLSYVVIYGRALDSYCAIQGLLGRLVPPKKIVLVLPPRRSRETIADEDEVLPVDAFEEGEAVEQKLHCVLESIGVRVHSDLTLTGVEQDTRHRLSAVRLIGLPGDTDKSEEPQGTRGGPVRGILERLLKANTSEDPIQYKITCRVLLTADGHSVDPRIFSCIYANELVYDGRLIVDHLFRTIDENIFAAGTLCEFSRRYVEAQGSGRGTRKFHQSLRLDGYNGREVGGRLAEAIVKCLDPERSMAEASGDVTFGEAQEDENLQSSTSESINHLLPEFSHPHVSTGLLPGLFHYYRLVCPSDEDYRKIPADTIVTDDLDQSLGTGHFCEMKVDKLGKISELTYLGGEPLELHNLHALLGMPVAYLNDISKKCSDGQTKAIIEYLEDSWAKALFHERFTSFTASLTKSGKAELLSTVRTILSSGDDERSLKDQSVTDELVSQLEERLPSSWKESLKDRLVEYIRENEDHLPDYFFPEEWATLAEEAPAGRGAGS